MKTRAGQVVTMMGVGAVAGVAMLFALRVLPPRAAAHAHVDPPVAMEATHASAEAEPVATPESPAPQPQQVAAPATAAVSASPAVMPVALAPPFVSPPKPEPALVTPAAMGGPTNAEAPTKPVGTGKASKPPKPYAPSGL